MGLFFKKKTTLEILQEKRTNCVGESMDRLDANGNLPFGWVVHNQNYVQQIENDLQPFRQAILDAKTDVEKYAALKSFVLFLEDGKKHYSEMGECIGKYFEEYICDSEETKQRRERFEAIKKKLKGQE